MIGVIDYGAGNLKSIVNGLKKVEAQARVVSSPEELASSDAIILPGVGHFGDAMTRLAPLSEYISSAIQDGKPFLGLCLGVQVLFESSEEAPGVEGLGIFKGSCKRFPPSVGKVPHMGWNDIKITKETPLLEGLPEKFFYFVHSYYADPEDKSVVAASCDYGMSFPAVVAQGNTYACQFHPERSGKAGLKILENFVGLI
jgi:imidazole glycerol-phosphate synthase subunit HisH